MTSEALYIRGMPCGVRIKDRFLRIREWEIQIGGSLNQSGASLRVSSEPTRQGDFGEGVDAFHSESKLVSGRVEHLPSSGGQRPESQG